MKKVSKQKGLSTKAKRRILEKEVAQEKKNGMERLGKLMTGEDVSKTIAAGAAGGALYGLGKSEKEGIGSLTDAAKGGVVGGATSLLFPIAKGGLRGAKTAVAKGANIFAHLGEDITDWILRHPGIFKNAKDLDDVAEAFLKRLTKLGKKGDELKKSAALLLKKEQELPKNVVTEHFDDVIKEIKERVILDDTPLIGKNFEKLIGALEEYKNKITKGKFGYDPESELISERHLWSLYKQLENEAEAFSERYSQDFAPMLSNALKQVRFKMRDTLAQSNPKWNKEFEPVRQIEKVLGSQDTIKATGVRDAFGVLKEPHHMGGNYIAAQNKGGVEQFYTALTQAFSAPFESRGLQKQRIKRDLIDDVEDLYAKHVEGKKAALGPVKIKTKGKIKDSPTLLTQGEGALIQKKVDTMDPQTGKMGVEQKGMTAAMKQMGVNKDVAEMGGVAAALIKSKVAKRLTAEGLASGKKPLEQRATEKLIEGAETSLTSTGIPRLIREPVLDPDEKPERSRELNWELEKRKRQVEPGEPYGIDRFKAYRPEESEKERPFTPEQLIDKDEEEFYLRKRGRSPESSFLEIDESEEIDFQDHEKEQREKNAISFLRQQKGLRKPKYT